MKYRRMAAMLLVIALVSLAYVSMEFVNKTVPGQGTASSDATTSATTEAGNDAQGTAPAGNAVTSATPNGGTAAPGAAPAADAVTSATTTSSSSQTTGAVSYTHPTLPTNREV